MTSRNKSQTGINLKTVLIFLILPFISLYTSAQKGIDDGSKYGHGEDSLECIKNLSLYREFIHLDDYTAAYPYWQLVLNECPEASKNIYIDGAKMLRNKLDEANDTISRKILIDSLMMLYDKRIEHYDEQGEVYGRQGVDLFKYSDKNNIKNIKQAYELLKESVGIEKYNVLQSVLDCYLSASLILYKNSLFNTDIVISDYLNVYKAIEILPENNTDPGYKNIRNNIIENFLKTGLAKCDTITKYLTKKINTGNPDTTSLKAVIELLRDLNCTSSTLYYNCLKQLFALEPSVEGSVNLAVLAYNSGKYDEAGEYYKQAAELETNNIKKADYYYNLAIILNNTNNKTIAREYALKAIKLKENWGDPYLLIGQMYAESNELCASISLPNAIYWLAVDMFIKAKSVDPSATEKADKLIQIYSKYYPNAEDAFFSHITEGNSYTIGCWINETTKARFNK